MIEMSQLERTCYTPEIPEEVHAIFPQIGIARVLYQDEVVFNDMDRTLIDTDVVMARSYAATDAIVNNPLLETGSLSMEQMQLDRNATNGISSFQIPEYIRDHVAPEEANGIIKAFVREFVLAEQISIAYPDTPLFIDTLNRENIPHMAATRGPALWQPPKVMSMGFPTSFYRTDEYDKTPSMQLMRDINGMWSTYNPIGNVITVAPKAVLIEDTAEGLENIGSDEALRGYWLWRVDPTGTNDGGYSQLLKKQKGEVSGDVEIIYSLDELTVNNGKLQKDLNYTYGQEKQNPQPPTTKRLHLPLSHSVQIIAPDSELLPLPHAPVLEVRGRDNAPAPMSAKDIQSIRELLTTAA